MSGNTRTLRVVIVGNSKAAQRAIGDLGGSTRKAESQMGNFASGIGKKMAAIGAAIGSAQLAKKIYDIGSSYEQNMNVIASLDPTANIRNTNKALQDQSGALAKLGLSTVQGSDGLKELIKAGQTTKDALKSLTGTMVLATAGEMSTGDAAALVANNLNAFHLKASKASDIANVLANAANLSSADVSDLGMALSQSGSVAAMAGLSFEQTTSMLTALSNVGIQGSDAGTSLKTAIMRLSGTVPEATKNIKNLGVSMTDSHGKMKPVGTLMVDLQKKLDKLSEPKRREALGKIFGSDAIRAANALLPRAGTQLDNLTKAVQRSGGAASAAAARTKGLSGVVNEMKARSTSAMQAIYSKASPTLEKLGRSMLDLSPKIQKGIAPAFAKVKTAMAGFAGGGMGQQFGKTFQAIGTFGKAMLPTLQEIGGKIMGVLGPAFKEIGGLITTKLLPAFQAFLPAITPVAKFLLNVLGGAVVGALKGLVMMIKGIVNVISGIFQVLTAVLTGNWRLAWEGVKNILLGAIQIIWGRIQWVWNVAIIGVFRQGFTLLKGLITGGWNFVKSLFTMNVTAIGAIARRVVNFILSPFRGAMAAGKGTIAEGWATFKTLFSQGVLRISTILRAVLNIITAPYRMAFSAARGIVSAGWSAIKGLFTGGVRGIGSALARVGSVVTAPFRAAIGALRGIGSDIIGGLIAGITSGIDRVRDAAARVANALPGPVKKILDIHSPSRVFAQLGEYVIAGLIKGLDGGTKRLKDTMASLAKQVRVAFAGGRISGNQRNALLNLINKDGNRLMAAAAKRERVANVLKASNDRLAAASKGVQSLKDAKANLAGKIGENITSSISLSNLANVDDGYGTGIAAIMARMRQKLSQATSFRNNLLTLGRAGLSGGLLQQIAEMGPDTGGAVAAELVRGSSGQLAELNRLQSQTESLAANAGNYVAGAAYDGKIKSAQAKVITEQRINSKLQVEIKSLDKANDQLAKLISAQVRNEIARINRRNGK